MLEAGKKIQAQLFRFSLPLQAALYTIRDAALSLSQQTLIHTQLKVIERSVMGGGGLKRRQSNGNVLRGSTSVLDPVKGAGEAPAGVAWTLVQFEEKQDVVCIYSNYYYVLVCMVKL